MHTIILAIVIALAGLVMIASGALQLSMLEAAEGEILQISDYLSEIGTSASGLGMLGLAEVLRLLLRITPNFNFPVDIPGSRGKAVPAPRLVARIRSSACA